MGDDALFISLLTFGQLVLLCLLAVKACNCKNQGLKPNKIGSIIAYNFAIALGNLLFANCELLP